MEGFMSTLTLVILLKAVYFPQAGSKRLQIEINWL